MVKPLIAFGWLSLAAFLIVPALEAQNARPGREYVSYACRSSHGDAVYRCGQTAAVVVSATKGGNALADVQVRFTAGPDKLPADTSGTVSFSNGEARVCFGTMNRPGFRWCELRFTVEGESFGESVKVAFSPEEIAPTVTEPADFDAFWQRTLRQAAKVPMTVEEIPMEAFSDEQVETRLVKLQNFEKGRYVYGYVSLPRDGEKHPVLLIPPGAGVKRINPLADYAREGFIVMAIGVNGFPLNCPDSVLSAKQKEIGDYWFTGLDSPETYYYRAVYSGLVRCIDYLCSLPQFDGRNVGVTGGSQGGALTMVAAALDPRVTFIAAFYPALCDVSGFARGTTGGWPRFMEKGRNATGVETETALATYAYYDVVNFAKRIRVPGFYSHGYNDNVCPPTSVRAAFNQVKAPMVLEITPASAHWRYPESNRRAIEWMKAQCR